MRESEVELRFRKASFSLAKGAIVVKNWVISSPMTGSYTMAPETLKYLGSFCWIMPCAMSRGGGKDLWSVYANDLLMKRKQLLTWNVSSCVAFACDVDLESL